MAAEVMQMTNDNSYIPSLPLLADELIDIILSHKFLDYRDLCRFAQVCVRFRHLPCYSEIWKKKARRRWNRWQTTPDIHWKEVFKKRFRTQAKIEEVLEKLGRECGSKADVSYKQYEELSYLGSDAAYSEYLDCTLEEYIFGDPRLTNLTYRYYAKRLYIFFRRNLLKKEWKTLMSKPEEKQHLEDGALIIAKWMDYKIDDTMTNNVKSSLDTLAERVRNIMGENDPSDFDLEEHSYYVRNPCRCLQIVEGIKQVMFVEENFCGNTPNYYDVNNSLITKVLQTKQGIPISLAIVFIAVARRLRLEAEPVNAPNHFLVRWRSNQDSRTLSYTYIDVFDGGKVYDKQHCIQFLSVEMEMAEHSLILASPKDVFIRMASNILNIYQAANRMDNAGPYTVVLQSFRDSLELLIMMKPQDKTARIMLAQVHLHLGINFDESIQALQEQSRLNDRAAINFLESAGDVIARHELIQNQHVVPKLRSDHKEVAFKVGMVMRHVRYNYGCVIRGWDPFCDMEDAWIYQMGVDRLPNGRNQPFYNVLADDGSLRYAAQESLTEDPIQAFNTHHDLEKYFECWTGSRYIPNYYLRQQYSEDVDTEE